MGRTLAPYSRLLEKFQERFAAFRRGLRKEDQILFEKLMDHPKRHVQAGVYASFPNPSEPAILSILLEMQKEINQSHSEIQSLKEEVQKIKKQIRK